MSEKWKPRPPPRTRAGALGFIFVLLLCMFMAAVLFVLNPAAQSGGPLQIGSAPTRQVLQPGAAGWHGRLWLPLISK